MQKLYNKNHMAYGRNGVRDSIQKRLVAKSSLPKRKKKAKKSHSFEHVKYF